MSRPRPTPGEAPASRVTVLDPVCALTQGRSHYKHPVPDPTGVPTAKEVVHELLASCEAPMRPVEGQAGQTIGYRCPRCGTLAAADGRTQHGPRTIRSWSTDGETVLQEPEDPVLAAKSRAAMAAYHDAVERRHDARRAR